MRITYTEKNGRKYAYMCTSKRVHGKRNPVSERTYVGVVDSCTGRIIPKKGTSAVPLPENGIRIKSHGDVAIVMSILDRLGIRKDLESAFGERGDIILAIAAAQAVRPSKTDMVEHTLRSSTICDMLDLRTSDFTLKSIKSVINSISSDEVGSYFVTRHARFPGRIIVFSFTNSLTDGIGAPIKRLLGHPVDDSMAIALMMTESGNPIGFAQIHEPSQDISDLVSILERVRDSVSESTFVSDTFSAPSLRFTELLMRGLDIVLPFSVISAQYHSMESAFGEVISPENEIQLSRGTLYMKEGRAGVCLGRQGYTFVPPDDDRFPQCGQCMRAFISYDSRINTSTVSAMETIVCNTKARLNGIPSDDPEFDLRRTAGALSDIMKVSKDRDGFMKVTARRDKVDDLRILGGRIHIPYHQD